MRVLFSIFLSAPAEELISKYPGVEGLSLLPTVLRNPRSTIATCCRSLLWKPGTSLAGSYLFSDSLSKVSVGSMCDNLTKLIGSCIIEGKEDDFSSKNMMFKRTKENAQLIARNHLLRGTGKAGSGLPSVV
mmetsp:Transcript_18992/g.41097  ORF Transcript_18992/g.41097 Transcript_18992/m.41097 type:complete len:131 (-) Transcript_18992:108-500(-)